MVLVYTTAFCADCWRVKKVLESLGVAYQALDINGDEDAYDDLMRLSAASPRVPTVVLPSGEVLVEPDAATLTARLFPPLA
jgi:glutaredoxin